MLVRILLLSLLLVAGCGRERVRPKAGQSLLIVTIDTLRADRLGAYGYEAARTPALDALARNGVLFEEVIAPVPVTLPSHASLFTGLVPPTHGVRDNATFRLSEHAQTLAEILSEQGYETAAFVGAYVLDSSFGLDQGFAQYDDEIAGGGSEIAGTVSERKGEEVTRSFLGWLEGRSTDEPFFAWIHYFDPHLPYEHGGYDGEISYVDEQVRAVLDALDSKDLRDDTLIVVTSDHGESLGEHGEKSHGFFVYDSTLRVPLILASPGSLPRGERVSTPVQTIDVFPSILEALELPVPPLVQGRSVLSLVGNREPPSPRAAYSECYVSQLSFHWAPLLALRENGYKFIEAPRPELYDLGSDPGETNNLAETEPERLLRMRARLAEELESFPDSLSARLQPDAETIARLRALGYASSEPSVVVPSTEGDDPKDRIHLWTRLQEVILAKAAGDSKAVALGARAVLEEDPQNLLALELLAGAVPDEAIPIYERILEIDDSRPLSHVLFGNILWKAGKLDEAERSYRAALERDADFVEARKRLGELYLSTGRADEAVASFRGASGKDVSSRLGLARSLRASGKAEESMRELEGLYREHPERAEVVAEYAGARAQGGDVDGALAVLARGPDHHDVHYTASVLYRARNDMARSLEELDRALALEPRSAVSLHDRGVLLSRMGRLAEAVSALESAVAVKDSPATRNALGTALCRMERCADAVPHFERAVALAPEFVEALENLAQAYWIAGRKAEAERTQERAESLAAKR